MANLRYLGASLLLSATFVGCTTGPDYAAPSPAMPEQWVAPEAEVLPAAEADLAAWWKTFQDPTLDNLIASALEGSQDLEVAEARLREARALRGISHAALFPTLDMGGTAARTRTKNNFDQANGDNLFSNFNVDRSQSLYEVGFDAGWELDLFGGNRRALEAAEADLGAAVAAVEQTRLSLVAEVARNYIELRGTQGRLLVARRNRDTQKDLVAITESRYHAGLATELQIKQAQGQLSATASTIPTLEAQALASIYRLGVLLGKQPGALIEQLGPEAALPAKPPIVPIGLPSELLRRRPDIRQGERELAAATARIGEATADLFPKFSMTGNFGVSSTDSSGFSLGVGRFWSVGPAVQFPIFDSGRIRANIEVQNARTEAALARYEQSVNTALEEAEKSLAAYAKEQQRREILASTVRVAQEGVDIATEMYTKGLVSFIDVIQTQDALFDAEDRLIQSEQFVLQNLIAVYKAVGGGWENATPADS